MPTKRLLMRRIRDVLRLKLTQGMSDRAIAASLGLSKGSVNNYVTRARQAGLEWPLPEGLDDDSLELLLFPDLKSLPTPERPIPDWSLVDRELRKRNVSVLTATERRDLLEIFEDRQGRGSTIVTSQLPVDQWHEAIGDPTLADAILDRLVHNAHRLTLTGESMRRKMTTAKPLDQLGQA